MIIPPKYSRCYTFTDPAENLSRKDLIKHPTATFLVILNASPSSNGNLITPATSLLYKLATL